MARNRWTTETWNGSSWDTEANGIYRPNENLERTRMSTQSKIKLATGDNAFFTPETKFVKEPMTFQWLRLDSDDAFITQLTGYIENGTYVRITDHKGAQYAGKFTSLKQVWIAGIEEGEIDIESVFEIQ